MDASRFDVQRLDHLGLVAGVCNTAGLEEEVDKKTSQTISQEQHF